jgi:hypothetical protein
MNRENMMETFSVDGDNVNVSKIMQQVQQRIEKKRESGIYTEEELQEVTRLRLENLADEIDIDSNLIENLRSSNAAWNITPDYQVKSHRKGLGYLVVLIKKIVRPIVRLYTDHIVKRQAQINLYSVHVLHNLVQEITRLQIDNKKMKNRLDHIDRAQRFMGKRFKSRERPHNPNNHSGKRRPGGNRKNEGNTGR